MPLDPLPNLGAYAGKAKLMLDILDVLNNATDPLRSGEICRRAGAEIAKGNRAIRRLYEKGMVERTKVKRPGLQPWQGEMHYAYVYLLKKEYRI